MHVPGPVDNPYLRIARRKRPQKKTFNLSKEFFKTGCLGCAATVGVVTTALALISINNRPRFRDPATTITRESYRMGGKDLLKNHTGTGQVKIGAAPRRGQIRYSGYVPDALNPTLDDGLEGASRTHFHMVLMGLNELTLAEVQSRQSKKSYTCRYNLYRHAVERAYGAQLADSNYFMLTDSGSSIDEMTLGGYYANAYNLGLWLTEASRYGEPLVGLEMKSYENVKDPWVLFRKKADGTLHPALQAFKEMAEDLDSRGVTFRVRFLSEAEQQGSDYFTMDNPKRFRDAARLFRDVMPKNVKMVFSPAADASAAVLKSFCTDEKGTVPFDAIGCTAYSNMYTSIQDQYDRYYGIMRHLYPNTPFEIDEAGAPFAWRNDFKQFLDHCEQGRYSNLTDICIFGAKLSEKSRSQQLLGRYGFVDPLTGNSYLRSRFMHAH